MSHLVFRKCPKLALNLFLSVRSLPVKRHPYRNHSLGPSRSKVTVIGAAGNSPQVQEQPNDIGNGVEKVRANFTAKVVSISGLTSMVRGAKFYFNSQLKLAMTSIPIKGLLTASLSVTVAFYGSWSLLTEVLRTILPFGMIFALLLCASVHFLRVLPPDAEAVEAVVGREPHLVAADCDEFVMRTVAHRGAGLDAPENTLAAFKMCSEKGCETIEFDVTLTKDDVPVVFHDATLERMTDLTVNVNTQKWDELSNIDLSVKHPLRHRFATTNIPTLEQAVTQLLDSKQRMFIDIKDHNFKMVKVIHDLFEKYPELYCRAVVSSFYPTIIYQIRRGNPKIVCSLAWRPYSFAYDSYSYPEGTGQKRVNVWYVHHALYLLDKIHEWALPRITYYLLGISMILLHKDALSGKAIIDWRKKGVRVIAWTVNSPLEKQHVARVLKITYLTDTLTGEGTTHAPQFEL